MRRRPFAAARARPVPPWQRIVGRVSAGLLGAGLLLGAAPAPVAADVVLRPDHTEAGAQDVRIGFELRNDNPADPVVDLRVDLPTARPLEGVTVPAVAGWQATASSGLPLGTGGRVAQLPRSSTVIEPPLRLVT